MHPRSIAFSTLIVPQQIRQFSSTLQVTTVTGPQATVGMEQPVHSWQQADLQTAQTTEVRRLITELPQATMELLPTAEARPTMERHPMVEGLPITAVPQAAVAVQVTSAASLKMSSRGTTTSSSVDRLCTRSA